MTNLPAPAGALDVGEFDLEDDACRHFTGSQRGTVLGKYADTMVIVEIVGEQWTDGRTDRFINVQGDLSLLPPAEARKIAADMLAAADEAEALSDPAAMIQP